MKYRTDFVTNSSSSSFAGAIFETLLALLAQCDCNADEETDDDSIYMETAIMPQPCQLEYKQESVYLYARMMEVVTLEEDAGEELVNLPGPTGAISFEIEKTHTPWASLDSQQLVEDWNCIEVLALEGPGDMAPPEKIEVEAKVIYRDKTYKKRFKLPYIAAPKMTIKPEELNFLTGTKEMAELVVAIANPSEVPWELQIEADSWADRICTYELETLNENCTQAKLYVTENEEPTSDSKGSTDHYISGKITVKGISDKKETSDYAIIYVWREGLFLIRTLNYDRETGQILIKADKDEDGSMIKTGFDLRFMKWSDEQKKSVCTTELFESDAISFSRPEPKSAKAESIFTTMTAPIEYIGVRPSNLPSGKFEISLSNAVPGKEGERYPFELYAELVDEGEYFCVLIPFAIIPAFMSSDNKDWKRQFDGCVKIINDYLPPRERDKKLNDLESSKNYMGIEDLKKFRHECWAIAYAIIMEQKRSYEDEAAWYDNALYVAEWVKWLNDRAFNVVLGCLTGPLGSVLGNEVKGLLEDLIEKVITCQASDRWVDIGYDIVQKRLVSTVGGTIDANYFSNPERSKKWIACFLVYKIAWHWAWDYEDDGKTRKGLYEACKAAAFDLTGVGLEEKIKPFIEGMAKSGGFTQNMSVDEYVANSITSIKKYIEVIY
jgi:hypothetical protein